MRLVVVLFCCATVSIFFSGMIGIWKENHGLTTAFMAVTYLITLIDFYLTLFLNRFHLIALGCSVLALFATPMFNLELEKSLPIQMIK